MTSSLVACIHSNFSLQLHSDFCFQQLYVRGIKCHSCRRDAVYLGGGGYAVERFCCRSVDWSRDIFFAVFITNIACFTDAGFGTSFCFCKNLFFLRRFVEIICCPAVVMHHGQRNNTPSTPPFSRFTAVGIHWRKYNALSFEVIT